MNFFFFTENKYFKLYFYIYLAKIVGTLGKYDQRRLWKLICIVNPFDLFLFFYYENRTFHWIVRILNEGKYYYEIKKIL